VELSLTHVSGYEHIRVYLDPSVRACGGRSPQAPKMGPGMFER
jgi:hypothetical protein